MIWTHSKCRYFTLSQELRSSFPKIHKVHKESQSKKNKKTLVLKIKVD